MQKWVPSSPDVSQVFLVLLQHNQRKLEMIYGYVKYQSCPDMDLLSDFVV